MLPRSGVHDGVDQVVAGAVAKDGRGSGEGQRYCCWFCWNKQGCLGLQKKKLTEKPWSWLLFVHVCLTFLYQMGKKLIFFSCDVAEQVHRMIRGGGGVL